MRFAPSWQFLARLGLSPSYLKRNDRGAVAVGQRTQYKREVLAGTPLHISTELLELGRTSIRFMHRMYDTETTEEVAVTELVGVYFDTSIRTSAPLPELVREKAEELLADRAEAMAW